MFANRTTLFNLETQLTDKVRAELIGRGKYKIVLDIKDTRTDTAATVQACQDATPRCVASRGPPLA